MTMRSRLDDAVSPAEQDRLALWLYEKAPGKNEFLEALAGAGVSVSSSVAAEYRRRLMKRGAALQMVRRLSGRGEEMSEERVLVAELRELVAEARALVSELRRLKRAATGGDR